MHLENPSLRPQIPVVLVTLGQPTMVRLEPNPKVPMLERFDGNHQEFHGFLKQCNLLFLMTPVIYPDDQTKMGLNISILTRDALDWASQLPEWASSILNNFDEFIHAFSIISDGPNHTYTAKANLLCLSLLPVFSASSPIERGTRQHRFTISAGSDQQHKT